MALSWDLVSPVEYTLGEELNFNLHFEAPSNTTTKKFYIIGGLYTDTTFISGSLFGVLKAADVDYGVNSSTYMSAWELEPEQVVDLPCRFIINRTNCLLALFLMEMVGDEVDLDNDIEVAQILTELAAPIPVEEEIMLGVTPLVGGIMLLGIVTMMIQGVFKR